MSATLEKSNFQLVMVDEIADGPYPDGMEPLWVACFVSSPEAFQLTGGLYAAIWRSHFGCLDVERVGNDLMRDDIYHGPLAEIEDHARTYCCITCCAQDLHTVLDHV